ncbi:hypothetical protein EVAR_88102_1 [Eumeta japonica]|uniref:Uncharacterized protein n=1 Tax=Eumeta variegata TaxID=151549 RepID=A0A4C1WFQ3_EUMVA|nr:hypothetical protein EVAR_88102_1 [Eumeta japonica]
MHRLNETAGASIHFRRSLEKEERLPLLRGFSVLFSLRLTNFRPCQPPTREVAPAPRRPPVAPYCHCDAHAYSHKMEHYRQLVNKETELCRDYEKVQEQLGQVVNDILDHPCDDVDSKMATMFQISFKRKGFPVSDYRKIMAAVESKAPVPVAKHRLGILRCYKDPTNFKEPPPRVRPTVQPAGRVHLGVMPKSIADSNKTVTGKSEYIEKYNGPAEACLRSMQRYREPLPSTRRRADDRCVFVG